MVTKVTLQLRKYQCTANAAKCGKERLVKQKLQLVRPHLHRNFTAGGVLWRGGQLAHRLVHTDLTILDELDYLPFSSSGGALLFHLLPTLYELTCVVITTNLSLSEWAPAIKWLGHSANAFNSASRPS